MIRAAFVVLALALGSSTATTQDVEPPEHVRLANGLEVVAQHVPGDFVGVCVAYRAGTADDPDGYRGLAHLTEHSMFTGSPRIPRGIFAALEPHGATFIQGTTHRTDTTYCSEVPKGALDLALYVEADRMGFLLDGLFADEVTTQRRVVLNEHRERLAFLREWRAAEAIVSTLWPEGHPMHTTLETEEGLGRLGLDQVRWFHRRFYGPANAIVAVVGDLSPAEVFAKARQYFARLRGSTPPIRERSLAYGLDREHRLTLRRPRRVSELLVAWPTPPWHAPGDAELDIVAQVLRDRLEDPFTRGGVRHFRARQRSTTVGSQFTVEVETSGARAGTRAETYLPAIDRAIEVLQRELLPPERLRELKDNWAMRTMFYKRSPYERADQLARTHAAGNLVSVEQDAARYRAITAESVRDAARRLLPLDRRLVMQTRADANADRGGEVSR